VGDEIYQPTVSIGGCLVQDPTAEGAAEALVDTADRQLYRAKAEGRNRVEVASAS
jgi:GGDEF domain-containing protein